MNRIQGLKDALEKQDCEIAWEYNEESDTDICAVVDAQESVDYMVVMDTQALDTLGEHAEMVCIRMRRSLALVRA